MLQRLRKLWKGEQATYINLMYDKMILFIVNGWLDMQMRWPYLESEVSNEPSTI